VNYSRSLIGSAGSGKLLGLGGELIVNAGFGESEAGLFQHRPWTMSVTGGIRSDHHET
jgi:hypothetical protein